MLYALTLNPYVLPAVRPVDPPVTEYVVTVENGEYPTTYDHVAPLVPESHSRKYERIDEPPLLGADKDVHESSNLDTVDVDNLVGDAI